MKRRILHRFTLSEISAVDRPAQKHATAVIMKRADNEGTEAMDNVLKFAKMVVAGRADSTFAMTRDDFTDAIAKMADETRLDGESDAQAFTRAMLTPEGSILYKASRVVAPRPRQAPQDYVERKQPTKGPAAAAMDAAVAEFMAENKKLTRAQAYDRVYNNNHDLRARVKAEEAATQVVADQRVQIEAANRVSR
jgi:hypothetical protein